MPMRINTVIVFGDSLSDIGIKWKTKSGITAILTKQMYVSPTGRYSDCRNWTDYMYEAATTQSLIVESPQQTITNSKAHTYLHKDCYTPYQKNLGLNHQLFPQFNYANYAEGGACGDTPASKKLFLGTFDQQIEKFKKDIDCHGMTNALGNVLFLIWFGANDLYTAGRTPTEMSNVAEKITNKCRSSLSQITNPNGQFNFIYINLAQPLSSVRYRQKIENHSSTISRLANITPNSIELPDVIKVAGKENSLQSINSITFAKQLSIHAVKYGNTHSDIAQYTQELEKEITNIQALEEGVITFNTHLKQFTNKNNDGYVDISTCLSEENIYRLVRKNPLLKHCADSHKALHMSSKQYDSSQNIRPLATIDEAHPTDYMYKVIWEKIYETIRSKQYTFGVLT